MNIELEILTRLNTATKLCGAVAQPCCDLVEEIIGPKSTVFASKKSRRRITNAIYRLRGLGWDIRGHRGYTLGPDDYKLLLRARANKEAWELLNMLSKCPSPLELKKQLESSEELQEIEQKKVVKRKTCYDN